MKAVAPRSAPPTTASFHTFLKPGALAQLRYSKITARSKQIGAQTLLALCNLNLTSDSEFQRSHSVDLAMDRAPCFDPRTRNYPRCLHRKKLIAVTPFFTQAQS